MVGSVSPLLFVVVVTFAPDAPFVVDVVSAADVLSETDCALVVDTTEVVTASFDPFDFKK